AAAFMLVKFHDAERELDHAGLVVKDDDSAGAEKLAALAERVEIHVHLLGFFRSQYERGRAAGDNGFELASIGNAAANVIDHLLQRIAKRQFVDAGFVD